MNPRSARGLLLAAGAALLAVPASVVVPVVAPAVAASGNQCSNPVLASNLNGWGPLDGAAVSRDPVGDLPGASWAFDTSGRSFYMPQLSVSPGQTWTFSAQDIVVFGSGTAAIGVDWYGSGGAYLGQVKAAAVTLPQSSTSTGSWKQVSGTFTVPSGATTAHVLQFGNFGTATGTDFKGTMCDYELAGSSTTGDTAAAKYGWGTPNASQSDEYNGTSVDLTKWGLFGADPGKTTGCSPGYNGHGQRCASQTTEANGLLSVTGTANGVTGGLYARTRPFKYGRVEIRERAVALQGSGAAYHAVPLLWPQNDDYTHAEIDFAERDVAAPEVDLFVHHDGGQTPCQATLDSQQFHNYAIDWEPTSVTWYVDGALKCTVTASISNFDTTNGGAQLDMFPSTGTTMRPARQDVDWIRMYPVAATQYL